MQKRFEKGLKYQIYQKGLKYIYTPPNCIYSSQYTSRLKKMCAVKLDFNQKDTRGAKNGINISGRRGNCQSTQPKDSDVEFDTIGWYCRTKRVQKGMSWT